MISFLIDFLILFFHSANSELGLWSQILRIDCTYRHTFQDELVLQFVVATEFVSPSFLLLLFFKVQVVLDSLKEVINYLPFSKCTAK